MLEEIKMTEAVEEVVGKDQLERELDRAFEAAGGENADLSKVFPEQGAKPAVGDVDVAALLNKPGSLPPNNAQAQQVQEAEMATDSSAP